MPPEMAVATDELTIDELAQRTGMTARNIRAHQSRGLLTPPTLRGRTGYYNLDHVERIELIQDLQADGYSLELIGRLLRSTGCSAPNGTRRASANCRTSFGAEQPVEVELSALQRTFRSNSPAVLKQMIELGYLRPAGDSRYEETTPEAWRGAAMLAELGIPAEDLVDAATEIHKAMDVIANRLVRLFADAVWGPFEAAGHPREGFGKVLESIERLRPEASVVVQSVFQVSMAEAIEKRLGPEIERLGAR
jgi:DNA-binding transcriptional MerR regulator